MKYAIVFFMFVALFILPPVYASDYVLPYPSFMPGNKAYRIMRMVDEARRYWSFGSLSSTKYYLGLSDKYLIEAKTLFEYRQYPLALDALSRSDKAAEATRIFLVRAQGEAKDASGFWKTLHEAMEAHAEVLAHTKMVVPETFFWQPEKQSGTQLNLHKRIEDAIRVREKIGGL